MNDISSHAGDAKDVVSARLRGMEGALDGFPAAVLLDDFLAAEGEDHTVDRRARALCKHILRLWATTIERDLERFPPATNDALQEIRQRMTNARDALLRVRSLLQDLSKPEPSVVKPIECTESSPNIDVACTSVTAQNKGDEMPVSEPSDERCQSESGLLP